MPCDIAVLGEKRSNIWARSVDNCFDLPASNAIIVGSPGIALSSPTGGNSENVNWAVDSIWPRNALSHNWHLTKI